MLGTTLGMLELILVGDIVCMDGLLEDIGFVLGTTVEMLLRLVLG